MAAQLTLILGGIASGKSALDEKVARATGLPMICLAIAQGGRSQARAA